MAWVNKETKYVADKPEDWDNPKNNFTNIPRPDYANWDYDTESWLVDEILAWEAAMLESDITMSRAIEDLWEAIGISKAPIYVQELYTAKKDLRDSKPDK